MDYNRCFFIGRTTKPVDVRTTNSDKTVARVGLALNGSNNQTQFINLVFFGKSAELAGEFLYSKGTRLFVECAVNISNYDDRDGNKRTATDFFVNNFIVLSPKE